MLYFCFDFDLLQPYIVDILLDIIAASMAFANPAVLCGLLGLWIYLNGRYDDLFFHFCPPFSLSCKILPYNNNGDSCN